MPTQYLDFEVQASADGAVSMSRSFHLPISVGIRRVFVETKSECRERTHHITSSIDGTVAATMDVVDCQEAQAEASVQLRRGSHEVALTADGFDPGETVRGRVGVSYRFLLLQTSAPGA
jgi:hypothetical protein